MTFYKKQGSTNLFLPSYEFLKSIIVHLFLSEYTSIGWWYVSNRSSDDTFNTSNLFIFNILLYLLKKTMSCEFLMSKSLDISRICGLFYVIEISYDAVSIKREKGMSFFNLKKFQNI